MVIVMGTPVSMVKQSNTQLKGGYTGRTSTSFNGKEINQTNETNQTPYPENNAQPCFNCKEIN